ncbi:MAG TPA: RNA polymerase sigma factor FliA [Hydrogenophilus thermoluteolus]|nr:RNA polymerase sigma factor FliA [Hydrogenophilus thermoluteolus]
MSVTLSPPRCGKNSASGSARARWLAQLDRAFFVGCRDAPDPKWWGMAGKTTRDVNQLVQHYAPMVKRMAMQLAARLPANIMLDDLIQYGMMGLLEAIERYEVQDDAQFETYAVARVRGAMLDALRTIDWVPRSVRQAMREVEAAIERLTHQLGRQPSDAEVADAIGWSLEDYFATLSAAQGHAVLYYDDLIDEDQGRSGAAHFLERHLGDDSANPEALAERRELQSRIAHAITQLPEREQTVLALYYEHELNLKEIGAVLEVSESRVSQILSSAIARIRAQLLGQSAAAGKRRGRPRKQAAKDDPGASG